MSEPVTNAKYPDLVKATPPTAIYRLGREGTCLKRGKFSTDEQDIVLRGYPGGNGRVQRVDSSFSNSFVLEKRDVGKQEAYATSPPYTDNGLAYQNHMRFQQYNSAAGAQTLVPPLICVPPSSHIPPSQVPAILQPPKEFHARRFHDKEIKGETVGVASEKNGDLHASRTVQVNQFLPPIPASTLPEHENPAHVPNSVSSAFSDLKDHRQQDRDSRWSLNSDSSTFDQTDSSKHELLDQESELKSEKTESPTVKAQPSCSPVNADDKTNPTSNEGKLVWNKNCTLSQAIRNIRPKALRDFYPDL